MKSLYNYISFKLLNAQKEKLLTLDKEYGRLMMLYRQDRNWKDVLNVEEEYKKFSQERSNGRQYFPVLKFHKCKFPTDNILQDMISLRDEFLKFDCFLSKYYIDNLTNYIFRVKYTISKITDNPQLYYLNNNGYDFVVPDELYDKAVEVVSTIPFDDNFGDGRNIDAKTAAKDIQAHIDDMGYGWKVTLNTEMMPRMNVNPDGVIRIKQDALFSKNDIEGLKAHEIDGHIGRRFYGFKTGLNLFIHGLNGRNVYDEGLAVWNSLHKVETPKPNILFLTALKTILVYNSRILNFCELFDLVKKYGPTIPDKKVFAMIIRTKREIIDMSLPGAWPDDASYFCGYQMVNNMSDKERDDILKYNIGPDQFNDLPKIKQFLEINHFDPLPLMSK